MKTQVERLGDVTRRIHFEVSAERIRSEMDASYRKLKGRVRLPGFRPGKVPREVLELRYSRQVRAEVVSSLVQEGWEEVQPDLRVQGRPQVEEGSFDPGTGFTFTITVEVKPDLQVEDYRGLEVTWPEVEVSQDQVEAALRKRLEQASRIVEAPADAVVGPGHIAIAEVLLKDGEEEVAHEIGTAVRIGQDPYLPGVDDLLQGLTRGGEREGEVRIHDTSELESLKGRTLQAYVKIHDIHETRAPELSDEVARELGFEGGASALRDAVREEVRRPLEERARHTARQSLLRQIVDAHPIEVPKSQWDQQTELLVLERKVLHQYAGHAPGTLDLGPEVMAQIRDRALYATRASLLLEAIAGQEGITVSEDDMERAYQRIADERGQRVEAIKGYLQREEGAVDTLRLRLLEEKSLDWLLEQARPKGDAPAAEPPAEAPEKKRATRAKKPAPEAAAPEAEAPRKKRAPRAKKAATEPEGGQE